MDTVAKLVSVYLRLALGTAFLSAVAELRAVAGTDTLGPFVLKRNATPPLYKCL